MILSRPETDHAFEQLIAELEAEVRELNRIGSEVAYKGVPENATRVMRLAGARAQLRDHIRRLHELWQQDHPAGLDALTKPPPPEPPEEPPTKPSPLSRKVKGLTIGESAKKLLITPRQIRAAIESGQLQAYQRVNGKWKILPLDLIAYLRKHVSRG